MITLSNFSDYGLTFIDFMGLKMCPTYEAISKLIDSIQDKDEKYAMIDKLVKAKKDSFTSDIEWETVTYIPDNIKWYNREYTHTNQQGQSMLMEKGIAGLWMYSRNTIQPDNFVSISRKPFIFKL